jgi:sarcosine oxidase subunit alpha
MCSIEFEGRRVPIEDGDSVASALFRSGVRTFNRSLKYHRRRGLYCLSGDCPNCLCKVDGEPGTRTCVTEATDGMVVERETGKPSPDFDLLGITDKVGHFAMPVGFYYKTFVRPKGAWPIAERVIRSTTGVGKLPPRSLPRRRDARHVHCDTVVIGAGVAGLSAALAAAERGESVLVCDEGRVGEKLPPGPPLDRVRGLVAKVGGSSVIELLERHAAIGIYDGPLVPLVGPEGLVEVHPSRIVVATGATEAHPVFPGNDLPGVWLGRGAARMAGRHRVRVGERAVVVVATEEGLQHLETIAASGTHIEAAVVTDALADRVPPGVRTIRGGRVASARGRKSLAAVTIATASGEETLACDALVLSIGWFPRDTLLRMGDDLPVVGAGDVVEPGATPELGSGGYVCLCEDVGVRDLARAWSEGWNSTEILKRYTTATMGPCQGAMCGRHLTAFAEARSNGSPTAGAVSRTTARPPARTVRLEDLIGGVNEVIEKRTALHARHFEAGARVDFSGSWMRPYNYGDVREEIRAVRDRVSVMDVGTLGKTLIAGRDAGRLVSFVFPTKMADLHPGASRYMVTLDEAGYVMDDGLICALDGGSFYITSTSGGADRMEAWLRNWEHRLDTHTHIVNQTSMLGAINVAGPHARELLQALSDDPLDPSSFPYPGHREITVAGVPCRAIRVGFVGELSYELHHPRSRGVELWDALMREGARFDIRPHGLDALDVLRLEKGHFFLAQDTLPDDHPAKLGLTWAVDASKEAFVGKKALERMGWIPLERQLVGLSLATEKPQRGVPLYSGTNVVGRVTSCAYSDAIGGSIGLGWVRGTEGIFPAELRAGDSTPARVVPRPFYDPEGLRLRG